MSSNEKRVKPVEGFNDVELVGTMDNSEFKRADVGALADETGYMPAHTAKRTILEDSIYQDSATFTGEDIEVAERQQKISARSHQSGWKRYRRVAGNDPYDFDAPLLLVGQDYDRARLILRCVEGFLIVGSLSELSSGQGYLMAAGAELETEVAGEFYIAISRGHESTAYTWWLERN